MTRFIRQIRVKGQLAYVPLTKGYTAIIDAADAHIVDKYNWTASEQPRSVYAYRQDCSGPKRITIPMHRLIMGKPCEFQIDHIDGDGLNNRRCNLRLATKAQNAHNSRVRSDNKSGYKGVSWNKKAGKWVAQIQINTKTKYLGLFTTPEDAYAAYCKASAKFHGDFGRVG
jgi:hypothetical protein